MAQRARPDGRKSADTEVITLRLGASRVHEVKLLLVDPATGRMPYGAWGRALDEALELWLERRKIAA
jgi:hypothetical protein